jgi:meso-butanediol dehydrogenase / (S,S)-butanediol dehydrogenase / diacetyl reductase
MKRFEGKVAIITGASSGIGRASAQRLASEGAKVMLGDINKPGLEETAKAIVEARGNASMYVLDVSNAEACRGCVKAAIEEFGRLDVLCNIAGIVKMAHFRDITDEQWNRIVGVNLSSVFFMSKAAMPYLLETKGNIINMASTASLGGQVYNAPYCATKAGVVMLTKSMAIEFAGRGVRVNAICPGSVKTPLTKNLEFPEGADMQLISRLFPLMDSAVPEEIATAVAYLASPEARFVTGIAFPIDGGQTAG